MVEAQERRWVLKQKGRWEALPGVWPVVTIARELGDQGFVIGRGLAEKLGFSCWDRDLVMDRARLLNTSSATGVDPDDRQRDAIETFLGISILSQEVGSAGFIHRVHIIIGSIVNRGGAVIVGQGAQYLVDARYALRVRLVSPFELRAKELRARERISFEAAKRLLLSSDREHALFVLHALGQDVGDSANYDIVVNVGSYEWERVMNLVLMAYFAKFGDWPLTARALKARRMQGPALGLSATNSMMPGTMAVGGVG
jgi:hypothetical protein